MDPNELLEILATFMIIITVIVWISIVVSIINYILKGIALNLLCNVYNVPDKWIAWIPIFNYNLVLNIGERGTVYVFVPILQFILGILIFFTNSIVVLQVTSVIYLGVTIWWIVIQFQAYRVIAKKLDTTPVWLNIGIFIPIFHIVAWSLIINRTGKLEKEDYFTNYISG